MEYDSNGSQLECLKLPQMGMTLMITLIFSMLVAITSIAAIRISQQQLTATNNYIAADNKFVIAESALAIARVKINTGEFVCNKWQLTASGNARFYVKKIHQQRGIDLNGIENINFYLITAEDVPTEETIMPTTIQAVVARLANIID